MSVLMLHDKDYVRFEDVGENGLLTATAAMRRFHAAANQHTVDMHVSGPELEAACGGRWIITKMRMEFDRVPKLGDNYEVSTWPLKAGSVKFPRCWKMTVNGESAVRATSDWCILSRADDSLIKASDAPYPADAEHCEEKAVASKYVASRFSPEESEYHHTRVIRWSDVDYNGHTNNLHYLNMTFDCFCGKEMKENVLSAVEIHYMSQTYECSEIRLYRRENEDGTNLIAGIVDGETVFRAAVVFAR